MTTARDGGVMDAERKARLIAQAQRQQFSWTGHEHYWDEWEVGVALADYRMPMGDAVLRDDVVLVKPTPSNPNPGLATIYSPRLKAHVGVPIDLVYVKRDAD